MLYSLGLRGIVNGESCEDSSEEVKRRRAPPGRRDATAPGDLADEEDAADEWSLRRDSAK